MGCLDIQNKLSAYIDGMLDELTMERIEAHLSKCSECRVELQALKSMLANARNISNVEPPSSLRERIRDTVAKVEAVCGKYIGMLPAYIDNELNPIQYAAVSGHINKCNNCADELEIMKKLTAAASSIEQIEPPIDLKSRIIEATLEKSIQFNTYNWIRNLFSVKAYQLAGGLVVATFLVFAFIFSTINQSPTQMQKVIANHKVSAHQVAGKDNSKNQVLSKVFENAPMPKNKTVVQMQKYKSPSSSTKQEKHVFFRRTVAFVANANKQNKQVEIQISKSEKVMNHKDEIKTLDDPKIIIEKPETNLVAEKSNTEIEIQEESQKQNDDDIVKVASAPIIKQEHTEEWFKQVKSELATMKSVKEKRGGIVCARF